MFSMLCLLILLFSLTSLNMCSLSGNQIFGFLSPGLLVWQGVLEWAHWSQIPSPHFQLVPTTSQYLVLSLSPS